MKNIKPTLIRLAALSLLSVTSLGYAQQAEPVLHVQDKSATITPAKDVKFPDPESAWPKGGSATNAYAIGTVVPGLTKQQLAQILTTPHFSEGAFGVVVWDYLFLAPGALNSDAPKCQYQVHFGDDKKLKATYWNNPDCAKQFSQNPIQTAEKKILFSFEKLAITTGVPPQ